MAAAVSDEAWLAALLRFERELAAAEAGLGLIPAAAAQAIATATTETRFDYEALGVELSPPELRCCQCCPRCSPSPPGCGAPPPPRRYQPGRTRQRSDAGVARRTDPADRGAFRGGSRLRCAVRTPYR